MPPRKRVAKKPFDVEEQVEEQVEDPPAPPARPKRGRPSKSAPEPAQPQAKRQRVTRANASEPPQPPEEKQRATRANTRSRQDQSVISIEEVVKRSNAALNEAKRPATRARRTLGAATRQETQDEIEVQEEEQDDSAEEPQDEAEEEQEDDADDDDTSSRMVKRQLATEMLATPAAWGNLQDRHRAKVRALVPRHSEQRGASQRASSRSTGEVEILQSIKSDMFVSDEEPEEVIDAYDGPYHDEEDEEEEEEEEEIETNGAAHPKDTVLLSISFLQKMSNLMSHAAWTGDQQWERTMLENDDGPNSGLGQLIRRRLNRLANLLREAPRPQDISHYDFSDQTEYLESHGVQLGKMYERVKDCVDTICKERLGPMVNQHHDANSTALRGEMVELLLVDIVPHLIHVLKTACTLGGHKEDGDNPEVPQPLSPGVFTNASLGIVYQISEWLLRVQKALLNELHREEAANDDDLDDEEDLQATETKTKRFALEPLAKQFRMAIRHAQDELDEHLREPARLKAAAQRDAQIKASRAADEDRAVQDADAYRRQVVQSSQALRGMVDPQRARWEKLMGGLYSANAALPVRAAVPQPPVQAPRTVSNPLHERYKAVMGSRYSVNGHSSAPAHPAAPPKRRLPWSPRAVFKPPPPLRNSSPMVRVSEPAEAEDGEDKAWTSAEIDFVREELQKGAARNMEAVAGRLGRPFNDVLKRAHLERKAQQDECKARHLKVPEWAMDPARSSLGGAGR